MTKIGQVPVSLSREMPGFVLNRMQYALLNECFRLVLDDVGEIFKFYHSYYNNKAETFMVQIMDAQMQTLCTQLLRPC